MNSGVHTPGRAAAPSEAREPAPIHEDGGVWSREPDYAVLSGRLLAKLEHTLFDLQEALPFIPKFQKPLRSRIERRIVEIRAVLAQNPAVTIEHYDMPSGDC